MKFICKPHYQAGFDYGKKQYIDTSSDSYQAHARPYQKWINNV